MTIIILYFVLDIDDAAKAEITALPLMMDSPAIKAKEAYAEEAKLRVEELFEQADKIEIEYDQSFSSWKKGEWVYIWLDEVLLQEVLVTEGYAIPRYIEEEDLDDKYIDAIFASADYAKRNNYNVWNDGDSQYLANAELVDGTAAPESSSPSISGSIEAEESNESYFEEISEPEVVAQMVYIAPNSGTKYHFHAGCRRLNNANSVAEITLTDAQNQGYTLCGWED